MAVAYCETPVVRRFRAGRVLRVLIASSLLGLIGCTEAGVQSAPDTHVELDFTRMPDGPAPSEFSQGQPTFLPPELSPGSTLRVENGKLTFAPTEGERAAGYLSTGDLGGSVTNLGAQWTFTPQAGGTPGAMALAVTRDPINPMQGSGPPMPIHFVVTRNGWEAGVWTEDSLAKSGLVVLASGEFVPPLREDGETVYSSELWLDSQQVTAALPSGELVAVTDPRIALYASPYAFFECYSNVGSSDSIVGFTRVWAGTGAHSPPEQRGR